MCGTNECRNNETIFDEIAEDAKELKVNVVLTSLTLIGLAAGIFAQLSNLETIYVVIPFTLAYLAGGGRATKEAFEDLLSKHLSIDLLMVLAALAAAGVGQVRDGAILLFLFSLASTLEGYAMGNTKRAVAALMELRPDEANVLQADGSTKRMAVELVHIGQQVVVRPGERMPVDGKIISGMGAVDQSSVTGESVPADKEPGDLVFAGTVNQNSVLTISVTKEAAQSTISRMIEMVTEAQSKRSPSERFSEWFGHRYTIFVLTGSVSALGIFLLMGTPFAAAAYTAATLLVVASPCAIVISVPAAVLSALSSAARTGVLFKGGAALEDFGNVDIIACDKTGTLTEGKMSVTDVVPLGHQNIDSVLMMAGALEAHSDHPLARSVVAYVQQKGLVIPNVTETVAIPGKGIIANFETNQYWVGNRALLSAQGVVITEELEASLANLEESGKTPIIVGEANVVIGLIGVADSIRKSAPIAINELRKLGVKKFVMLTGDSKVVAAAVGAQLGLKPEEIFGALLPEDKVKIVEQLKAEGKVAFVGDGVNDAAALATSNVGVAMGVGGSDVAIEAADVALLSDDLERLAFTRKISQKTNSIIKQNLFFAVGIMALMVVTTIFWYLPLPLGVIGHEGGTLVVVANGLRLLMMKNNLAV